MSIVIYAISYPEGRYVASGVSRRRFVESVAGDLDLSEGFVETLVFKSRKLDDFDVTYENFRKIIKVNGEAVSLIE